MPLSRAARRRYPRNWRTEIRPRILARAGGRCEQCGAPDRIVVIRGEGVCAGTYQIPGGQVRDDRNGQVIARSPRHFIGRPVVIVLTIAHYPDPTIENCADENLLALCQLCHLRLDARLHVQNAWLTRRSKARNLELFELEAPIQIGCLEGA